MAHSMRTCPKRPAISTQVLEDMLGQAKVRLEQVMGLLKLLPTDMEECQMLLDRESKLNILVKQLVQQIEVRRQK